MVNEFALEPSLLRNWKDFRYFVEKFGIAQGRLISRYPKHWKQLVYGCLTGIGDIEKARITEKLKSLDDRLHSRFHEWNESVEWLQNAEDEHRKRPFRAIIASSNPSENVHVLDAESIDESNELFASGRSTIVRRIADDMARCIAPLLRCSRTLVFVDPYFGPDSNRHRRPLAAFLREALLRPAGSRIERILYHTATAATEEFLRSECQERLASLIPVGLVFTLRRWNDGELHNRYILTERGGVQFGTGLDEGDSPPDDLVTLLDQDPYGMLWERFAPLTAGAGVPNLILVRGQRL